MFEVESGRQPRYRRPAAALLFAEDGAAHIEYAVLLAITIGCLGLALNLFGTGTSGTFARVANGWNVSDGASPRPAQSEHGPSGASVLVSPPALLAKNVSWQQHAVAALTIVTLLFAWYSLRGARLREQQRDAVTEAAAVQRPARFIAKRQRILRTLSNCVTELWQGRLHVRHLMTQPVTTALPTDTVAELTMLMAAQDVRHLLICDRQHRLLGVVSDRDLRRATGKTAAQLMTRDPVTVAVETPIMAAVSTMLDRHFSSLPVVDGEKLVGIITTTDLAMALQCSMKLMTEQTRFSNRDEEFSFLAVGKSGLRDCEPLEID